MGYHFLNLGSNVGALLQFMDPITRFLADF